MRLFIHTETRAKLIQQHKKGGGIVSTEIMVTDDLGPKAQNQWIELCEKKEEEKVASTVPSPPQATVVRKIGKHSLYGF